MTQFDLSRFVYMIVNTSVNDAKSSLSNFRFDERNKEIVRVALAEVTQRGEASKAKLFASWLKRAEKPYGHEATVRCNDKMVDVEATSQVVKIHRKGSESAVRAAARMLPHFKEVLSVISFTQDKWIAAFGEGRM